MVIKIAFIDPTCKPERRSKKLSLPLKPGFSVKTRWDIAKEKSPKQNFRRCRRTQPTFDYATVKPNTRDMEN